jgi:hypothetical protein
LRVLSVGDVVVVAAVEITSLFVLGQGAPILTQKNEQ